MNSGYVNNWTRVFRAGLRQIAAASLAIAVFGSSNGQEPATGPAPIKYACDVPIVVSDGATMRANVTYRDDGGAHPVILTSTIYGKDKTCSESANPEASPWVEQGYARVVLDQRGTGTSQGVFDGYGPRTTQDAMEILDWVQAQPWSNGKMATVGCSAVGISAIQYVIADVRRLQAGSPRAVYTSWAQSPMPELLRDGYVGPGRASVTPVFAAALGLSLAGAAPIHQQPQWLAGQGDNFVAQSFLKAQQGILYDTPEHEARDLNREAGLVEIPMALVAEKGDTGQIQHGAAFFFRNLVRSRKPMIIFPPGGHCAPTDWENLGYGASETDVISAWFDRWLKGVHNRIDRLPNVNFHVFGAGQDGGDWVQGKTFPLESTNWVTYYLDNPGTGSVLAEGSLSVTQPLAKGADGLTCCPQAYPTSPAFALRYTSLPLAGEVLIAGPMVAKLFASFDGAEGALAVNLYDVAPDGSSTIVTKGQLIATDRRTDPARDVYDDQGVLIRPFHPLRLEDVLPLDGSVDQYLISLLPDAHRFAAGHRIRVTVHFVDHADTDPTTSFYMPAPILARMEGVTMQLHHGGANASQITLPVILSR